MPVRRFEFVPLWGIRVFFLYPLRRVDCPDCGVKVERVPWAQGKSPITTTYAWFYNDAEKVPFSERFQFLGDPRHSPYADTDRQGTTARHGYNW